MPCLSCQAGFHFECMRPEANAESLQCCCGPEVTIITGEDTSRGRYKDPSEMLDPTSTGRKEAARLKPLSEGMICEWSLLSKAGGGVIPIVGCNNNPAENIHHGPDKDTTNNSDDNLHRICTPCHNRWHTLNDQFYGERPTAGTPFVPLYKNCLPHNKTDVALLEDVMKHEIWWSMRPKNRPPYVNEEKINV